MLRRARASWNRTHHTEESGELNIVPYLDILVNLIMFLLVSEAALHTLGVLRVTADGFVAPGPAPEVEPPLAGLRLTLGVAREGFFFAAKGGVLPPIDGAGADAQGRATIPRSAQGAYDFAALGRLLRQVKTVFTGERQLYITADADVPYETIVRTLDAAREDARGELFPDVALAQLR